MELAIFFYVAGVVDNLSQRLNIIFVVWLTAMALALFFFPFWHDLVKDLQPFKRAFKWSVICIPAILLTASFIPSKDTMYTMAAAYGVQTAAENPNVQRVAGKSLEVLESKLDEYLKVKDK